MLGINALPMGIGMMVAPVIVEYIYDLYGTYFYSLLVMSALHYIRFTYNCYK